MIDGGDGYDTLYYQKSSAAIDWAAVETEIVGIEVVYGSNFDDKFKLETNLILPDASIEIHGGSGKDQIWGNDAAGKFYGDAGDDTIYGGSDEDEIFGGDNDDVIEGGAGDDRLWGENGKDILRGGADSDLLVGGAGFDIIDGGTGYDTLGIADPAVDGVSLELGVAVPEGDDKSWFTVSAEGDDDQVRAVELISLTAKSDELVLRGDLAQLLETDTGIEGGRPLRIDMGSGEGTVDTIDASNMNSSVWINLASGGVSSIGTWTDVAGGGWVKFVWETLDIPNHLDAENAEKVVGSKHSDILIGGGDKSFLYGEGQNDLLVSGGHETHIFGGAGSDRFELGANAIVVDANAEDSASYFGIPLFGGVHQWWMTANTAYWSPFTSLLTAYPLPGSSIMMVGAALADVATMSFAQYQVTEAGDLRVLFGWGLAGSATIKNYELDLDSGIGTANITVFSSHNHQDPTGDTLPVSNMRQYVNLALRAGFGAYFGSDPLVLDLDGDGYELTSALVSSSRFEFDGDGFAERSGWVRPDDGFLVRDVNANGKIDDLGEMFGNRTTGGFDILATYDSNADGVINASDVVFASLKVWQDLNQDGETQSGELKTLAELGIVSISLNHNAPEQATNILGNVVAQVGTFKYSNGTTRGIADVALQIDQMTTRWTGDETVSSAAAVLPDLKGFGELTGLRIAMTDDAALLTLVDDLTGSTQASYAALAADVEAILCRWAGVDGVAATAIGSNGFDARKLAFLEKYTGQQLMPRDGNGDLDLVNLDEIEALWADQLPRLTLRLAVQGPLDDLFAGFTYDAETEVLIATAADSLSDLLHDLIDDLPSVHNDALAQWDEWAPLIGAISESAKRSDGNALRSDFLFTQLVSAMDGVAQPLSIAELAEGLGLDNVRIGTSGAETLTRNSTERTMIYYGSGGNDTLTGGTGQDVYVFGRTIGDVTINDVENNAGGDRIAFAFLNRADVTLERDGNDLLITVTATDETIRVTGQFAPVVPFSSDILLSTNKGVEEIVFADGSVMGIPEIMIAVGTGTAGNDHLVGTMHSDALLGEAGDDLMEGGDNADIYVVNAGEGDDVIHDVQTTPLLRAMDMLVFGDEIAPDDLTFARTGTDNNDLLITIGANGDSVLIKDQFDYGVLGYNSKFATNSRIEAFAFREYGETYTNRSLQQMLIRQATTNGNDTTRGFGDDDMFLASAGNDTMIGLDGADTYQFGTGSGHDIIDEEAAFIDVDVSLAGLNYNILADTVVFSDDIELEDLVFSRVANSDDLRITITASGETLTIVDQFAGFQTGPLGAQWFDRIEWFQFGDDTKISWQDVLETVTTGGAGNDTLIGDLYTDALHGKGGNDYLSGRGYADTYVFSAGDGHDTIEDDNQSFFGAGFVTPDTTPDILVLGPGILPGDVTLVRTGADIDLVIGTSGDRVTLKNQNDWFHSGPLGILSDSTIEEVHFDDKTVWTWQDLNERLIADATTGGNDTTEGFVFDEQFAASAGNDVLEGGDGADTYVFGKASGQDIIRESVSNLLYSDEDVLLFDGLDSTDVTFTRDGSDLVIAVKGSSDSMRIEGQFAFENWFAWKDIEQFQFDDVTLSDRQVAAMLMGGTAGKDHIIGTFRSDLIEGGAGDDLLEGGDGADRYVYSQGDGHDEVRETLSNANLSEDDQIEFGAGITAEDLNFERIGDDLKITFDGASADSILIEDQFTNSSYFLWNDIDRLRFADGSFMTRHDIQQILLQSTSGNDHLVGFIDGDVLDGGAGDDLLEGGDGADTYVFGRGYGHDEIIETLTNGNLSEFDTVALGEGIAPADVTLTRDGQDLVIALDTGETLRATDHFIEGTNEALTYWDIDRILFDDGTIWAKPEIAARSIHATAGADTILGTWYDETIDGLAGADTIKAGGGNDTLSGGAGNDTIYGGKGNDVLAGGADNDLVIGDGGDDSYVFNTGDGQDVIRDFSSYFDGDGGTDTILLGSGIVPEDVTIAQADSGNDLKISFAGSSDTITIDSGITGGALYAIEQLKFANGTVWDQAEIFGRASGGTSGNDSLSGDAGANTLAGLGGNDTLMGYNGDDTLIGGAGNDILYGGGGDDSYRFGIGDGQDVIYEFIDFGSYGGTDTLAFGAGIAPGDVTVSQTDGGESLLLKINGTSDQVRISTTLSDWKYSVDYVTFADGTKWNATKMFEQSVIPTSGNDYFYGSANADTMSGGDGNDTLLGNNGADTLDGGNGNDVLYGGEGDDVYTFGIGGGQDIIREFISFWSYGGTDTLLLGAGIATTDITIGQARDGADLVIKINGTSDQITIENGLSDGYYFVDQIKFADNTVWSYNDMVVRSMTPTTGNDTIYGSPNADSMTGDAGNDALLGQNGNDTLDGGSGNDVLYGGGGDDTYLFGIGGGQDTIREFISYWSYGGTDTLLLGAGITTSDITIAQANGGADLVVSINGTSDRITIEATLSNWMYSVEQLKFADNTVWSWNDMILASFNPRSTADTYWGTGNGDTISAGAGNDAIHGGDGDDTLTGGEGNDTLNGGNGTDTAVYAGVLADYTISTSGGSIQIADNDAIAGGDDGTDTLASVEQAKFTDQTVNLSAPIVLDLDNDGVEMVNLWQSTARFDFDGDGDGDRTGWVGRDDGLLVLDRNGDGTVTDASEISFVDDLPGARSDLEGLAAFDSNGDGRLDVDDERFASFLVWKDADQDGAVDDGELADLLEAGIASISLEGTATEQDWSWNANIVINTGSFTRTDGSAGALADVAFRYADSDVMTAFAPPRALFAEGGMAMIAIQAGAGMFA
jgi:Ca2+-binding RTX toxin-like protein